MEELNCNHDRMVNEIEEERRKVSMNEFIK